MRSFFASRLNRLVLTYGLGLLLAFAAVGAVSFFAFERLLSRDVQQTVSAEHEGLMDVYRSDGKAGLRGVITALVKAPSDREALYLLVERDGRVSAGHRDDLPASLPKRAGWLRFPWPGDEALGNDDVLAFVQPLPDGGWLLTGHATGEQRRLRELVLPLGAAGLAALAALSGLLGWLLRRAVDRALRAPLDTVDRVGAGRLQERVPVAADADDAFARLARTLNRMLDRIHALVGGIQSSTDAIAHDLRTPLTRLRTRLEQARMASQDEGTRVAIDAAVAEAEQLLATFNSLLRLARIENARSDITPVALEAVLADAAELFQAVAEAKGQRLESELVAACVDGDRDLLFQLIANLLDNATRYAGPGSTIRVSLRLDGATVELCIADDGPGFTADLRERAFDRFVRGEAHRGSPGSGLGLSVVRAIAIHHGAEVRLAAPARGACLQVRFPVSAAWTNRHATESLPATAVAQSGFAGTTPALPVQN